MTVTPRKGRVSRNILYKSEYKSDDVTPRKGRVSRNCVARYDHTYQQVTPRKGRVSRNLLLAWARLKKGGHASQGACE